MTGTYPLLLDGRTQLWDSDHLSADQRGINTYCQPDDQGENATICGCLSVAKTSAHKICPKIYRTIFQKYRHIVIFSQMKRRSRNGKKVFKSLPLKSQIFSTCLFRMPTAHWAADLEFTCTPRNKSPGQRWPRSVCNSNQESCPKYVGNK